MVHVTRRVVFAASHRLHNPEWSEEKNYQIFDKCNSVNGHGHNYVMEVTVSGKQDFGSGYLIDLKILKKILNEVIVYKVDHKNLNLDVEFLKGIIPTVENLVVAFWEELQDKFQDGVKLSKIKLWETENNSIEYMGEPIIVKRFDDYIR